MGYKSYPHDEDEGLTPRPAGKWGDEFGYWYHWEPRADSIDEHESQSGYLGDDYGSSLFEVPGNPSKSILGGDNRTDLGLFSVRGNVAPEAEMGPRNYDWPGDSPLFDGTGCGGNPSRDELKGWMRGGSDALTFDGRADGR